MIIAANFDWFSFGAGVAMAFVGFMQIWNQYKTNQISRRVDATAKVVDVVHELSNSAMGAQKKMLAEVTAAKFVITHDPVDGEAAKEALADYLSHVSKQANADKVSAAVDP